MDTFKKKLNYVIAAHPYEIKDCKNYLKYIEDIIRKRFPYCEGLDLEGCGIDDINSISYSDLQNDSLGYIDYQSSDVLGNFLERRNITIGQFLFNNKYAVVIDNDNNYGYMYIFQSNDDYIIDRYGYNPYDQVDYDQI